MRKAIFGIFCKTILLLFLSVAGLHAQSGAVDSLFKQGASEIYEHPDKAIQIGKRIASSENANMRTTIKALVMISDGYSSKRDYRKAVAYLIEAQHLSDKLDDPIIRIRILTKAAVQYQQLRIYDKAIRFLDEARVLSMAYPIKDSIQPFLGTNYTIRGFIYKEQLDCGIAIEYFDKGIAEYSKIKTNFRNANLSIISYNKGNCYILLSDNKLARKCFDEAIAYAKMIDAKSLQAFAQKGLAEVYALEGNYSAAISELTKAEKLAANVGDLVLNQGLYRGLAENYLAIDNWEKYQSYQNLYLMTQNKIVESERKSVGISLKEQQKLLDEDAETSKRNHLLLTASLLVILALVIFLIFRNESRTGRSIKTLKTAIQKLK
ncbi:tetratricopeptide repeat protein [Flavobacterium sp.]|uniref:tetratricopeptide repeat protein n=1 Tax=Flavobacterium sp. TaxID=239 RepID=UPI00122A9959|nr:tetratricopeptide repeat protein [Flavobacterium sp.]RZJ73061.1 MAG: tetratricopeptide repeat protein [Flavobacterium sp.]